MNSVVNHQSNSVATIILAAGASRRMGQPKQLLPYRGVSLLGYVIKCAIASESNPVILILGANAQQIEPKINHLPVQIVHNQQWQEGISSSIRCGISYLEREFANIKGVVFLTCDQPFITAEIINNLINAYNLNQRPIIASHYQTTLGIPALFDRSIFAELMRLHGDRGAKKIINKYLAQAPDLVKEIDFPHGAIDLDTMQDYKSISQ